MDGETPSDRHFFLILAAQSVAAVLGGMIGWLIADWLIAMAVMYGALVMLIVNAFLARRMHAWSQQKHSLDPSEKSSSGVAVAAGRFVAVAALLVAAFLLGLWLPAVAGGMLVAQIAVYLAGFWLLVGNRDDKYGNKGETL